MLSPLLSYSPIKREMTLVLHDPVFPFLGKPGCFLLPHPNAHISSFRYPSGILHKITVDLTYPYKAQNLLFPSFLPSQRHHYLWRLLMIPLLFLHNSWEIQKWFRIAILVTYLNHIFGARTHSDINVYNESTILYVFMLHTHTWVLLTNQDKLLQKFLLHFMGGRWGSRKRSLPSGLWS